MKSERMDTVEKDRKFEQQLESVRNLLESTKYTKSVVLKPKDEVIYDPSMFAQLAKEVRRFGAEWFSWSGVFVVPEREESASPAKQESSQDETLTPVTEEHSSQSAEALLNDRINIELEKLQAHFRRKMSKSEVCESVAFLLSRGFKPEEIAAKVGVGRATVYRHILQEKTDNSVSQ